MERLNIEIPVSVGDKVYRTTSNCSIQTGEVIKIKVISEYYKNGSQPMNQSEVEFIVNYGYCNEITYKPNDLGLNVFPTRKGLIKHIVDSL